MERQEQETIISRTAADATWHIWTCIPQDIRRLDKDGSFTCVARKTYNDGTTAATYDIPAADWSPVTGRKRKRVMTDEQRAAISARLKAGRSRD